MNGHPLVSIGVPIFNEARFLRASLDAITAQDYQNIEVLISDNGSTDMSESICQEYVDRFDHVSYHRFSENHGPGPNFSYVLEQAQGAYFMWASGHDLWAPDYISRCLDSLTERESAVVAFGSSRWIDDQGEYMDQESGWTDTRGMDVVARFFTVLWGNMHPILGLIRTAPLREKPLVNMVGADLIVLTRLVLKGDFVHCPRANWCRREFRHEVSYTDKLTRYKDSSYRMVSKRWEKLFPLARLPMALVQNVLEADLSLLNKMVIVALLLPTFPVRYLSGKCKRV